MSKSQVKRESIQKNQGWQCPKCLRVHAPGIMYCDCSMKEEQKDNFTTWKNINE